MKISETVTRDCCQRRDLRPMEGSPKMGVEAEFVFCCHCGRTHRLQPFMDAAGSRDWEYRQLPWPWVPAGL